METETVAVPEDLLANLTLKWTNYKNAGPYTKSAARLLLNNKLRACSTALGRPTLAPSAEDWPRPDGWDNTIFPNVLDDEPIALLYPA